MLPFFFWCESLSPFSNSSRNIHCELALYKTYVKHWIQRDRNIPLPSLGLQCRGTGSKNCDCNQLGLLLNDLGTWLPSYPFHHNSSKMTPIFLGSSMKNHILINFLLTVRYFGIYIFLFVLEGWWQLERMECGRVGWYLWKEKCYAKCTEEAIGFLPPVVQRVSVVAHSK